MWADFSLSNLHETLEPTFIFLRKKYMCKKKNPKIMSMYVSLLLLKMCRRIFSLCRLLTLTEGIRHLFLENYKSKQTPSEAKAFLTNCNSIFFTGTARPGKLTSTMLLKQFLWGLERFLLIREVTDFQTLLLDNFKST